MTRFEGPDMNCNHCKTAIEKSILAADPDATVEVDLVSRIVAVGATVPVSDVIAAIKEAGFQATAIP